MNPLLKALLRGWTAVALIIITVALISGCGGGDPEPDVPTPQVNCALQPVLCQ